MDELEYDIYDDLDVFKGNEKQQAEVTTFCPLFLSTIFWRHFVPVQSTQQCFVCDPFITLFIHFQCESCAELRKQLNSVQQQNVQFKTELDEIEKNFHALLQTSRREIQRKDARIKELQKE